MAWENHDKVVPKTVASAAIPAFRPVKPLAGAENKVVLAASVNDFSVGFSIATGASAGNPLAVCVQGYVKAVAVASLGAGAEVGIASTNGGLGLVTGASGLTKYVVGIAENNAATGDIFTVKLHATPRQLDAQF